MARLLGTEALLMLLTALFSMTAVPWIRGYPPASSLFVVGFLMSLAYAGLYALANLGGQKMPRRIRDLIAVVSYIRAFWQPLLLALAPGTPLTPRVGYALLAPPLFGAILPAVAAARAPAGQRSEAALSSFYTYALPAVAIRLVLVALVGVNPFAQLMAVQAGGFYLLLRGLLRIFRPTSAEGSPASGPLVHRPVPDRIVGLVEGTTSRRARPYATRPDGSLDTGAISILCPPAEVARLTAVLQQTLAGQPFHAAAGVEEGGQVEVVVRPLRMDEVSRS